MSVHVHSHVFGDWRSMLSVSPNHYPSYLWGEDLSLNLELVDSAEYPIQQTQSSRLHLPELAWQTNTACGRFSHGNWGSDFRSSGSCAASTSSPERLPSIWGYILSLLGGCQIQITHSTDAADVSTGLEAHLALKRH